MHIQEIPPAVKTDEEKKPGLVEIIPDIKELLDYMEQNQQFRYEEKEKFSLALFFFSSRSFACLRGLFS